jgi:ribosomal protein S18 acetylase RimI-like enzyme
MEVRSEPEENVKGISIIEYTARYQPDFKSLNEVWISRYFKMEEADYHALDHPQEYILDKGGRIILALLEGKVVGTCALLKIDDFAFELVKMAVDPEYQGLGIGKKLGYSAIALSKELGATHIYLESNTILEPAIRLYKKLGFKKTEGRPTPYQRCNIQMELIIP